MQLLDSIVSRARSRRQKIVLAEGEDPRVLEAAQRAQGDAIADCILLGREAEIRQQAAALKLDLTGIRLEDPATSQYHQSYSEQLHALRKHKGMTQEQAQRRALDPLCFADLMLHCGDADGAIAGAIYTTGDRVRSALQIIGIKPGFNSVSSFMLMIFEAAHHEPKQVMLFADCALMIDPDAAQLAEIAVATVQSARQFIDDDPRVAMLSFSTDGSAGRGDRARGGQAEDCRLEGKWPRQRTDFPGSRGWQYRLQTGPAVRRRASHRPDIAGTETPG
jgi:phosphate acetyltransferase